MAIHRLFLAGLSDLLGDVEGEEEEEAATAGGAGAAPAAKSDEMNGGGAQQLEMARGAAQNTWCDGVTFGSGIARDFGNGDQSGGGLGCGIALGRGGRDGCCSRGFLRNSGHDTQTIEASNHTI